MIYVGIDYSLTSPAICIHEGDTWSEKNCSFYFFGGKPTDKKFKSIKYPEWNRDQERYQKLTKWVMDSITPYNPDVIWIEDYAFGANGRVFHIAENTGLMKYALYLQGYKFNLVSPTTAKKFATGKGNAKKEAMIEAFKSDTGMDIFEKSGVKEGKLTPSSDIVDAYWICKFGWNNEKNNNIERAS